MTAWRRTGRALAAVGLLLIGLLRVQGPVRADVLLPNQKGINYCFELTGMDAYPDYVFLAYFSRATGGHTTIKSGACVTFYKLAAPMIYAVRSAKFTEPPSDRTAEQTYFMTNPNLLHADIAIHNPGPVDKSSPIDGIVDVYHVASLDDTSLNVVTESVRYTLTNGKTQTVPWTGGDRPAPNQSANGSPSVLAAVSPAAVTATIGPGNPTAPATARVTGSATPGATSTPGSTPPVVTNSSPRSSNRLLLVIGIPAIALIAIIGIIVWQERQRGPPPKRRDG